MSKLKLSEKEEILIKINKGLFDVYSEYFSIFYKDVSIKPASDFRSDEAIKVFEHVGDDFPGEPINFYANQIYAAIDIYAKISTKEKEFTEEFDCYFEFVRVYYQHEGEDFVFIFYNSMGTNDILGKKTCSMLFNILEEKYVDEGIDKLIILRTIKGEFEEETLSSSIEIFQVPKGDILFGKTLSLIELYLRKKYWLWKNKIYHKNKKF